MSTSVLKVRKVSEDSQVPVYDEGKQYVLFASQDMHIPANTSMAIPTGIMTSFPKNYCALIFGEGEITSIGGLIDSDFRGEVMVITINPIDVDVKKGQPIGRMCLIEIATPEIVTVDSLDRSESDEEASNEN